MNKRRCIFGKGRKRSDSRGQMNSTEKAYSLELDRRKAAGEIDSYKFEAMTLTIADPPNAVKARLTPDFVIYMPDLEIRFVDVKGGLTMAASVIKLKCLAEQYPHRVYIAKRIPRREGGGWKEEEI